MSKGSFLLSDEWKTMFVNLPDDKAGQLIKAAFHYHAGEDFEIDDPVIDAIFQMIKEKIDENEQKYKETCRKRADAAKAKGSKSMQMQANADNSMQTAPDNDSEYDYEYENDSENNENDNNPPIIPPFKKQKKEKYGEYQHVKLTDREYENLCNDFGENVVSLAIKKVDEYCETTGKTYKNYNLPIRKWGINSAKEDNPYQAIDDWLQRGEQNDEGRVFGFG